MILEDMKSKKINFNKIHLAFSIIPFFFPIQHGHPYISAMINNGSLHYDHDRDGTHTQLSAGCVSKFRNLEHDTFVSIKYVHDTLTGGCPLDDYGYLRARFIKLSI